MCCGPSDHRAVVRASACDCTCCAPARRGFVRRFVSPKEEREALEAYKEELRNELAGLEEHIRGLEGK